MSYRTRVYYNNIGHPLHPVGWYYEVREGNLFSSRGAYPMADDAYRAMSRDIRSRSVSDHLAQLSLEQKEMMLGL